MPFSVCPIAAEHYAATIAVVASDYGSFSLRVLTWQQRKVIWRVRPLMCRVEWC